MKTAKDNTAYSAQVSADTFKRLKLCCVHLGMSHGALVEKFLVPAAEAAVAALHAAPPTPPAFEVAMAAAEAAESSPVVAPAPPTVTVVKAPSKADALLAELSSESFSDAEMNDVLEHV